MARECQGGADGQFVARENLGSGRAGADAETISYGLAGVFGVWGGLVFESDDPAGNSGGEDAEVSRGADGADG